MSRQSSRKRLGVVLPLLILAAYVMVPVSQAQCEPMGCIEYTVWVQENCRCECPDQACCDYWCPFIPYGCPPKGEGDCPQTEEAMAEKSALFELLQYEPKAEINRAAWTRRAWSS